MRKILTWIIASLVLLTLVGCSQNSNTESVNKTIKIGVIAPLSGPAANYGEDAVRAYEKIINNFHAEHTGYDNIELIIEDGKCDWNPAASAVQKLIHVDKVDIIVGGICSNETIPAAKVAQTQHVMILSPTSSAPSISDIWDYVFRYYNDVDATTSIANFFEENNVQNVAILAENTDICSQYSDKVKEKYNANYVVDEKFLSDEKDFSILAKKVAQNIDVIDYLVIVPNSDSSYISLMKALDQEWLTDQLKGKIIGNELVASDSVFEQIPDLIEWVMSVLFVSPSELDSAWLDKFMTEYKQEYPAISSDLIVALSAEAMQTTLEAIANGSKTSEDFKTYFENITEESPRTWLIGKYWFNKNGDGQGIDFLIKQVQNGELVVIK